MKRDNTASRRFLADAGIATGMRVIEIGCGNGEVTELLADLVGESGTVIAIDRNENSLGAARERLRRDNVRFLAADVTRPGFELEDFPEASFDALVGRRILMYLPDPAEIIQRLSAWLRTGAIAVFEESDTTMIPGRIAPLAAHDQAIDWLRRMLIAEGANPSMGFSLPATLVEAGLEFGKIRAEAVIQGQGTQYPLADLVTLMKPRLSVAGIATEAESEALAVRLNEEAADPARVFVSDLSFCAWAYKR